jgi:hypothetical protein
MKPTTTNKRLAKKGFIYLLKSPHREEDFHSWKFGCSDDPKIRLKSINSTNSFREKFSLIAHFPVKDKFLSEKLFKYFIWDSFDCICQGEFFGSRLEDRVLINKLEEIANASK